MKIVKDRGYVIHEDTTKGGKCLISIGYDDRRTLQDHEEYINEDYEGTVEWNNYLFDGNVIEYGCEFVKIRARVTEETEAIPGCSGEIVSIEITPRHG